MDPRLKIRNLGFAQIVLQIVALSLLIVACDGQISLFGSPNQVQGGIPSASPSPSPSPSPSASPADPCKPPVTGVNLSGSTIVPIGTIFGIDVTPVNASGPLEGALDYCNNGRVPIVESMSANLRCAGACSGWRPQFLAQGVGPFDVRIRVDSASAVFAGTVTR